MDQLNGLTIDIAKTLVLESYLQLKVLKVNWSNASFYKSNLKTTCDIISNFKKHANYDATVQELLNCLNMDQVQTLVTNIDCLANQIFIYLRLINSDSPLSVEETFSFTSLDRHIKLVTSQDFTKDTDILMTKSPFAVLSSTDEMFLIESKKDFSIITNDKTKTTNLMLGPVALANHNCNANCTYRIDKASIYLRTKRSVEKGEELTCYYDKNYFGKNNVACECQSCQLSGKFVYTNKEYEVIHLFIIVKLLSMIYAM